MKQNDLNRAVARMTGETIATVRKLGFLLETSSVSRAVNTGEEWESRCIDWDDLEEKTLREGVYSETV
jgi:hypothetical protein